VINQTMCVFAVSGILCVGVSGAEAQARDWQDRGFVGGNLGLAPQSRTFTEAAGPVIYGESGSITVPHTIDGGPFVDLSAGVRVWENFGVALGYSRFSSSETTASFSGQVPNPIIFGHPRQVSGTLSDVGHTETAVHAELLWMQRFSPEFQVAAILGVSLVHLSQDLVSIVTLTEGAPPFTAVAGSSVATAPTSKTDPALTFSADAMYFFSKQAGVGGFVRYSRLSGGNIDLPSPTGSGEISVDAGGVQMGFGVRIRF
jgi:hypothetical protein